MLKTVESVTMGQPDKVCDQIAEAIVDEYIRRDVHASVDIHVFGAHGMLMIGGEVNSSADFDVGALAKKVYQEIGYQDDIEVFVNIEMQSEEMKHVKNGVLDTVVINGYATNETRERLPKSVVFAHTLARGLDDLRKIDPKFSWMKPDGKVQITMQGDHVKSITVLASHHVNIEPRDVKTALLERLIIPMIGEDAVQIFINPIGEFTVAGFRSDSGASGRKICVDTYGGLIPNSDKSFVGKNPLRAERAGSYFARYVARDLIEQGLADSVLVNVVYSIGKAEPIHIEAICNRREAKGGRTDLTQIVKQKFDFRPEAIVERLKLCQPIYRQMAVYGYFGRENTPWK
ncbi:methionine adenosyltransferase domain-containing protein [Candidatus Uhrbacteria bacterium]|nr:methionine adenosyltransferase domain-containing protein [Candidatus Uhrbacteria bacterium]